MSLRDSAPFVVRFDNPACRGMTSTFFSPDVRDIQRALHTCSTCPHLYPCREAAQSMRPALQETTMGGEYWGSRREPVPTRGYVNSDGSIGIKPYRRRSITTAGTGPT